MTHIGAMIREAREARGLSLRKLGDAVGVTGGAVHLWEKQPAPKIDKAHAQKLAEELGIDATVLLGLAGKELPPMPWGKMRPIPVMRTTALRASDRCDFTITTEVVEMIDAPVPRTGVRSVYMQSDRMVPRFYRGEPVFYDDTKPPAPGDYVVIVLKAEHDEAPAMIRRLVKETGEVLTVEQHSPHRVQLVQRRDIAAIFRVIPPGEQRPG